MNTILIKILFFILFFEVSLSANAAQDSIIVKHYDIFYYEISIINSYSILVDKDSKIEDSRYSPTFRFKWKPNRKLSVGVESGYIPILFTDSKVITENGKENFKGSMYGIPALIIFNYDISILSLFGGFGTSYLMSDITALNQNYKSNTWIDTYNYGIGLSIPLAHNFSIGIEAKGFFFSKINKLIGQAGVNVKYGFYGY